MPDLLYSPLARALINPGTYFRVRRMFRAGREGQLQGMQLPFPVSFTQAFCEKGTIECLENKYHQGIKGFLDGIYYYIFQGGYTCSCADMIYWQPKH